MTNFQTVAVGFDGSQGARAALDWALRFAHATGSDVVVIHARAMREHETALPKINSMSLLMKEIVSSSEISEKRVRWIVEEGDACSVLLRVMTPPINADVVVVGSRSEGKREGLLLGSTSLELVEHATRPVVVVPDATSALIE